MINTLDYLLSQPCSALNKGTFFPNDWFIANKIKAALITNYISMYQKHMTAGQRNCGKQQ